MKMTSSSGIYKTVYHYGSYLLLLRKIQWEGKALKFHMNICSYFEKGVFLFQALPSMHCTLKLQN